MFSQSTNRGSASYRASSARQVAHGAVQSSKERREGATPRHDRCIRCRQNDRRTGRRGHRGTGAHGAAREHRPKISAMGVDFVGGTREAVLRTRFTEFAYHLEIASVTIPTHSSALKRIRRKETTVARPWRTFVSFAAVARGAPTVSDDRVYLVHIKEAIDDIREFIRDVRQCGPANSGADPRSPDRGVPDRAASHAKALCRALFELRDGHGSSGCPRIAGPERDLPSPEPQAEGAPSGGERRGDEGNTGEAEAEPCK